MTQPYTSLTTSNDTTESTNAVLSMLRKALLEYEDANGASASDTLAGRLYVVRAPDPSSPIFPYACIRLMNQRSVTGRIARMTADLEVQVYGRPWSSLDTMETVADLFVAAMTGFVKIVDGLTFSRQWQRDTMPMPVTPADSETCTIRLVFPLVLWPKFLTRLAVNSPS